MQVTKRFHAEDLEMNMTPMINVVFLLLVFFIVVSELATQENVEDLTLPRTEKAEKESVLPDRLIISINRKNQIWIGGRVRTLDEVARILKLEKSRPGRETKRGEKTRQPILIQADKYAQWRYVQDVIEKANEMQFWRLSFGVKMKGPQ